MSERVLRADVATGHAVAAAVAGRLLDADDVGPGREGHVDRRALERRVPGRDAERVELREVGRVGGVGQRLQHLRCAVVAAVEPFTILAQGLGPAFVVEHVVVGPQRHVRVDERRAAQAATVEHVDLAHAQRIERAAFPDVVVVEFDLELLGRAFERVGELAGVELAAPFEDDHLPAHARES